MSELDYIETLDDLSHAITAARNQIDGVAVGGRGLDRESSVRTGFRTGLSITSFPPLGDGDGEQESQSQSTKDLLDSWQDLVEALFAQRKFLQYAPSLETCLSKLSEIDQENIRHVRKLLNLMRFSVKNHAAHECTELRYVTLLEVMLSYNADWQPSDYINDFWDQVNQQLDPEIDGREFRRKAYGVLIALPWVPNSHGLYSACSFEDSESFSDDLPLPFKSKFEHITDKPMLRSDLVYQTLDGIRDHKSFTVVITYAYDDDGAYQGSPNGAGVGKTTLAALLAAHPSLANNYLLLWVDLPPDRIGLSCEEFMTCLESICEQISETPNWPPQVPRLEDQTLRKMREKEHMIRAKRGMAKLLQRTNKDILIVLDAANHEKDFEKFKFLENQSTIVITQSSFIPRVTYTMEMNEMTEDEAVELFANEACFDREHVMLQTIEANSILNKCRCHPLIIRTAARWFKLKQVTAGFAKGLEELNLELSMLKHNSKVKTDASKVLAEVMNIMLSPAFRNGGQPTKLLKLCFASAAVVFSDRPVPLDALHALWSHLLSTHPDAVAEIGEKVPPAEVAKRVWFISESFIHLGLFSKREVDGLVSVQIYHQLYTSYAYSLIPEVSSGALEEDAIAKWHGNFVIGYNATRKLALATNGLEDKCRHYALEKLVTHMVAARSVPKTVDLLRDDRFYRERLKVMGWVRGTRLHVEDCRLLQKCALDSKSASPAETRKVILSILKKVAAVLGEETTGLTNESRLEKAKALHLVGFTKADCMSSSEALTQFKLAMQLMTVPNHPFNAIIMYSQAVLHLLRNDHDKGLKKIKGCLKVLKDNSSHETSTSKLLQAELIQLRGDAMAAACDYLGAEECYEEALDQTNAESKLETGTALYRRGRLHQTMGELDQAISALTECINWKLDIGENNTNNLAAAYSTAGDIFLELQEDKRALNHFEKALEIIQALDEEAHELDEHLLKGKLLFLKSDDEGSNQEFEEARKITKKSPRLLMDQSAYDLRCMAKICMDRGEKKEAVEMLEEGLELTKDRLESLERGSTLYELGHCLYGQGETKEALACFEESLKIRKAKLGDCELVLDTLITIANAHKAINMEKESLTVRRQVLELTENLYRGNDEKIASALFGVGEALEALKQYPDAVATYNECKELLKRALCADHPDVANVLVRLAHVHVSQKEYGAAFECYLEALKNRQANLEPNHPLLAEAMYGIGVVARKRGEFDSAREYLQGALKIQKENEVAHDTCVTLIELGNVFRFMHDSQSAIGCYERCLAILDPEQSDMSLFGTVYLALGHAKLTENEIGDAMECYEHALKSRTELLGRDHAVTAQASRSMGIVKYLSKSYAEARIYLSDFIRVMDAENKVETVDYIMAMHLLAAIHNDEERPAEAKKTWSKALAILQRNSIVSKQLPELQEVISHRLEEAQKAPKDKGFFSRITELARFEDEVAGQLNADQKIEQVFRTYVFVDE